MLCQRLSVILRRPGMYALCAPDLEWQIRSLIYDLYYIDEIDIQNDPIREELITEGLYFPSNVTDGVSNLLCNVMPDVNNFLNETASVYARKAQEAGYLEIQNSLGSEVFNHLKKRIIEGEFSQGYDSERLLAELPSPSFTIGLTFCFASEIIAEGWLYFDFFMKPTQSGSQSILRNIRWPAKTFEDGFELTLEGYEQTRRGIAIPEFDGDTFIKQWQEGRKWQPGESLPSISKEPQPPRWKHLW